MTGTILQILNDDLDNGLVIYRSKFRTIYQSLRLNQNRLFIRSAIFLPRKLKELYDIGEHEFFKRAKFFNKNFYYSEKLYSPRNINNWLIVKLFFSQILSKIKNKMTSILYFDQWILLFDIKNGYSDSFWRYKKIIPPRDRFWADPFIIFKDNRYYIFVEEYIYKYKKGHISVITMDKKGNYSPPQKVIEGDYHFSYPFIIENSNKVYMVPETGDNNTIELYECIEIPKVY